MFWSRKWVFSEGLEQETSSTCLLKYHLVYEQKRAMKMVHTIFRPDIYAIEGKI